jgi:hypothetical protein
MTTAVADVPGDDAIRAATARWLERVVIGLNLCPFARQPWTQGRIRIQVSRATALDALLVELAAELDLLGGTDPQQCETTLLVHPWALVGFADYNDALDLVEALVRDLDLEGELQVASFHPDYRFADADADDPANASNRSPYPMLHLLREASVERAVAGVADPDLIWQRNVRTLRALGWDGWRRLDAGPAREPDG